MMHYLILFSFYVCTSINTDTLFFSIWFRARTRARWVVSDVSVFVLVFTCQGWI
jgi:hypothetical protein